MAHSSTGSSRGPSGPGLPSHSLFADLFLSQDDGSPKIHRFAHQMGPGKRSGDFKTTKNRLLHELWDAHPNCPRALGCTSRCTGMQHFAGGCIPIQDGQAYFEPTCFFFFLDLALQARMNIGCGNDGSTKPQNLRMRPGYGRRCGPDLRVGRVLALSIPHDLSGPSSVQNCPKLGCDWDDLNARSATGLKKQFLFSCIPVSHPSRKDDWDAGLAKLGCTSQNRPTSRITRKPDQKAWFFGAHLFGISKKRKNIKKNTHTKKIRRCLKNHGKCCFGWKKRLWHVGRPDQAFKHIFHAFFIFAYIFIHSYWFFPVLPGFFAKFN